MMNENFEIENAVAYEAVENLVLGIPDEADPIGVVHLTVMDLVQLLVEDGGYSPEDVQSLVSIAIGRTKVMN